MRGITTRSAREKRFLSSSFVSWQKNVQESEERTLKVLSVLEETTRKKEEKHGRTAHQSTRSVHVFVVEIDQSPVLPFGTKGRGQQRLAIRTGVGRSAPVTRSGALSR